MIITPDATVIGGDNRPGISIPGAVWIGSSGKKSTIQYVDLTTPELDQRITYSGSNDHMYWAKDGSLKVAASDEWPLEYRDGVAVGRHEPEESATNYQLHSQVESVAWADYVTSTNTASSPVNGPNGQSVTLFGSDRIKAALYDNSDAVWLVSEFTPPATAEFSRVVMSGTLLRPSTLRTYIARRDSTNYCYGLSQQVPAGNITVSFYRSVTADGVAVGLVQVESGSIATSPIITTDTTKTRFVPTIRVNQPGAKKAQARFNNGNVTQLLNIGNDNFQLLRSNVNWGEQYITRIEFE